MKFRSSEKFTEPLNSICDSILYVMKEFMINNPQYNYTFYGVSFDGKRPKRNIEDVERADVLVCPSESEWVFQVPGRAMNFVLQRTNGYLEDLRKVVDGKKYVIVKSDRADSEQLYSERVFPNNKLDYYTIDENDFDGLLHHLKYIWIKERFKENVIKEKDFMYWGGSKKKGFDGKPSGDMRHEILKQIKKDDELDTWFIGNYDGFKADGKWNKKFYELVPSLMTARSTLCFNWPGYDEYLTSRYNESMACGIVPLVWKNYDINNILVHSDWQRCYSYEDVKNKINQLSDKNFYEKMYNDIHKKYIESTQPIEYYKNLFEKKLKKVIEG